jgi:phage tail sheath protein FI
MAIYKTPGVYVEEISILPPSIAEVETAIPAFIGYTEKGKKNVPQRISSLVDYQLNFGSAQPEKNITVTVQNDTVSVSMDVTKRSKNVLFYAMQLYFANGGGPCYVISTGDFDASANPSNEVYKAALEEIGKVDEPTLLVFPDAPYLIPGTYYNLIVDALEQCRHLGDRFVIMDVLNNPNNDIRVASQDFRKIGASSEQAKYGAAYFPYLSTTIPYKYDEGSIVVSGTVDTSGGTTAPAVVVEPPAAATEGGEASTPRARRTTSPASASGQGFASLPNATQNQIRQKINDLGVELPPSAAVAGIYARVDSTRGVWKAPANEPLNYVKAPVIRITDDEQKDLNIDVDAGKSINAIRSFIGKGTKIWGARTLAGNDNEWRFINIRRFFNMVEESVKKSTYWAVFEPNDINTWIKVRAMIENYLIMKWKDGALAGAKPNDAFFVRVGLGQTMTVEDVLEGRMVVEIGLAAVRPAEFIILKFSHKLQVA